MGPQTLGAGVSGPRAVTMPPGPDTAAIRTCAPHFLAPLLQGFAEAAATNCPAEGMGLCTIAAAVAGLGVATNCSSKGEIADSEETGLPLRLGEGLKLSVAELQEGLPYKEYERRLEWGMRRPTHVGH